MVEVGSVTAKLVLDNENFMDGLSQAKTEVEQFVQSFTKSNLSNVEDKLNEISKALDEIRFSSQRTVTGINKLVDSFNNIDNVTSKIRQSTKQQERSVEQVTNKFKTLDDVIKRTGQSSFGKNITQGLNLLNQTLTGTNSKMNTTLRQMQQQFNNVDKEATEFEQTVKNINNQSFGKNITQGLNLLDQALTGTNSKLNKTLRNVNNSWSTATNTVRNHTTAVKQVSTAQDGYNASANRGAEATLSEVGAMSTLGSIVGNFVYDMFYQLGSSIFTTVQATISAKSEMEGYFQQMNWSSGSIERFNNALESTVKQYQKLNKYNLGETMASLGVEFELNAQELANGMETVAMIQSEYVRAGRTEAEATLAVKDILQGEFLRLSRETGVGKEEVLEAGWDGDLKNLNSLLKALEKIGKDRHWDLFAQKANSLNDVLIITKNRMAELATDITSFVTPAIIGAFNGVIDAIDWLKSGFEGLGDTGQWIVGLNGLIPVVGGLTSVILRSRTGVGLLASANEGWLRTIQNLISGGNTLEARVGGWNGVFTALIDKIKGVDTASYNLIGALTNLDGELYKNKGTLNQLATSWAYNAGVITENEIATTKTTTAFRKLALSTKALKLGGLIALFTALAIVIADVTAEAEKNREAWNGLTDMYDNGQAIIDDAKTTYENLGNSVTRLREKQATLKEGSAEYKETTTKLNQALKDQELAYKNIQTAQEAYKKAQEIKQEYDSNIDSSNLQHQQRLTDLYKKLGYNTEEASRNASELTYNTAEWNRVATEASTAYNSALMSGDAHITSHIQALKKQGATQEEINGYIEEYGAEVQKNAELQAKWKQGDIWAGLGIHLSNLKKTWIDLTHDKTFMRFFNGLKEMIDTVTPSIMALASAIKDVLWFAIDKLGWLLESQIGQWVVFSGLVGTAIFTLLGKFKGFGKVISTVTTNVRKLVDWFKKLRKSGDDVGDVLDDIDTKSKGNDGIILESPDYGDLGGKGKPSNTPDTDDDKKNKKKKSSGWLDRITGGIDWLSEGKNATSMGKGIASGMFLVAEAILMIIPALFTLGAVGFTYDLIDTHVNKGIEALDKIKWVLLAFVPPVVGLMYAMSMFKGTILQGQLFKQNAMIIVSVLAQVAIAIGMIIPSIGAIALIGVVYGALESQVNKGIEAIDTTKWILLTIAIPIIALGTVLSYWSGYVAQVTTGMVFATGIVVTVMAGVALVLNTLAIAIGSIALIGVIDSMGHVNKGVKAIESTSSIILIIGVAIIGLGSALTWASVALPVVVAGIIVGMGVISVAMLGVAGVIASMSVPIKAISEIGKYVKTEELNRGIAGLNAVAVAITLVTYSFRMFNSILTQNLNILLWLVGVLTGNIDSVSTIITSMADTIKQMKEPLEAIAELGSNESVDIAGIEQGTAYLKDVAYALTIIDDAVDSLISIDDGLMLTDMDVEDEGLGEIIDDITAEDGVVYHLKDFANKYNTSMANFPEVDESHAEKITATATAIKAVNDAIVSVKEILKNIKETKENANVPKDALPTADGITTVADAQRSENPNNSISSLLNEVESVITDLNDFNNSLNNIELTTPNTTVAPFMDSMAKTISKVKSAVEQIKLAVQGIGDAEVASSGAIGSISNFLFGASAQKSGLSKSLDTLYEYIVDIVNFNNMLSTINTGSAGNENISQMASLTETLSNAVSDFTTTVTESLPTLKNAGKSMGTSFLGGLTENLSQIKSKVSSKLNEIDSLASSMWTKGARMGSSLSRGLESALSLKEALETEMDECLAYLDDKASDFWTKGARLGNSLKRGFQSTDALNQHSPGDLYKAVVLELTSTAQYMANSNSLFYNRGASLGNSFKTGFMATNSAGSQLTADGLTPQMPDTSGLYGQVQTSANQIMALNYNTTATTNSTWSNLGKNMDTTFRKMTNDATSSYSTINKNTKSQLVQMRGVTENNINGIRDSWNIMQNALINSAEVIRSQVTSKISQLESNMGSFWAKVRNPALLLGAGSLRSSHNGKGRTNSSRNNVKRTLTHGVKPSVRGSSKIPYAGPLNSSKNNSFNLMMNTNSNLKNIALSYLECLLGGGENCYAGDYSDWNFNWSSSVNNSIKKWRTHFGAIYDAHLKVGSFENDDFPVRGNAQIFKNYVLEHIGKTSYAGYTGPQRGSPLQIWNSGSFNCYDGMILIRALASAFGLSSGMEHGYWNGIPHVWATVEGVGAVDATAIQNGYGLFAPSRITRRASGGGSPSPAKVTNTVNVTVNIESNGETVDGKSLSETIGEEVENRLIKLMNVNPATGY